jgi:hypothetical protein
LRASTKHLRERPCAPERRAVSRSSKCPGTARLAVGSVSLQKRVCRRDGRAAAAKSLFPAHRLITVHIPYLDSPCCLAPYLGWVPVPPCASDRHYQCRSPSRHRSCWRCGYCYLSPLPTSGTSKSRGTRLANGPARQLPMVERFSIHKGSAR